MADMQRILAIDIGSGTQDILIWDPALAPANCPKMVFPSATTLLARRINRATDAREHLFLSGRTMGGGPCSRAVREHLRAGLRVFATPPAARTFHDDLQRVRAMGVEIVEEPPGIRPLRQYETADLDMDAVRRALEAFEVPLPTTTAVAVQDHGFSPNASNRAFRFKQWADMLEARAGLDSLIYRSVPAHLTRMQAVCASHPGTWVMDTGAAAILGALLDPAVAAMQQQGAVVLNVGNEHTVAALVREGEVWGIYEHHTALLSPEKLRDHLEAFRRAVLTHEEVFDDMGHGCRVLPEAREISAFNRLSLTGPNRERFSDLGGHMAAPYGDMMLTGCFGLVEAVGRRGAEHG